MLFPHHKRDVEQHENVHYDKIHIYLMIVTVS